jgi:hypothetical protein
LPFYTSIPLLRYLIALRVNRGLARLPLCLAPELSLTLGATIASRLPTRAAQPWRKALQVWDAHGGPNFIGKNKPNTLPEAAWPIEATLTAPPAKRAYATGELVFWELKLLGDDADHLFFLETILPALEQLGCQTEAPWHGRTTLWGRFDVFGVWAARGLAWEPLATEGELNLRYRPTLTQWAEGLPFEPPEGQALTRLTWAAPFDFGPTANAEAAPSLALIFEQLLRRLCRALPGKRQSVEQLWAMLDPDDQFALTDALGQATHVKLRHAALEPAPQQWPGRWLGRQVFNELPLATIPYLQLASILHLGAQTHLGCGAFWLE